LNIFDAKGNVQIIQKNTRLTSDIIHYVANANIAEFRGSIVEMVDKDNNRLRTMIMDYYTKDSVAVFNYGGSILDKDSNAIESYEGTYDAKAGIYKFSKNVEVKNDSLVVKSDSVIYFGASEKILFLGNSTAWKGNDFMRFKWGLYDRKNETYNFRENVYMNTPDQEIWADSVSYRKKMSNAELFGGVQIVDTAQSAIFFGDYARYIGVPQNAILTQKPSVALYSFDKGVADTLFVSGDTIKYETKLYKEIDSTERAISAARVKLAKQDGFESLLKTLEKPASAPKTNKTGAANTPLSLGKNSARKGSAVPPSTNKPPQDKNSKPPVTDTSAKAIVPPADTAAHKKDSIIVKSPFVDTTSIKYIKAFHKVKIYRSNLQGKCDSLIFTSLDSIARLYKEPVLWHEKNQFSGDSIQLMLENKQLNKVELLSSAFTIAKEDSTHFNQIKAANIAGYFVKNELTRFDALGGVSVIFFFAEDSVLTTMNQKECRALKSIIKDNSVQRVKYIQEIKSNAYPLITLEKNKQKLRGFSWDETLRPKNRFEVCDRPIYESERESSLKIPLPYFSYTNRFFKFKTRYSPDIKR
jgi:lipopolysaccharide export system protein LptA